MEREKKARLIQICIISILVIIMIILIKQCSDYKSVEERMNETNNRWDDILYNKTCQDLYEIYKSEGSMGKCPEKIGACSVIRMKEVFDYKNCSQYSIMVQR